MMYLTLGFMLYAIIRGKPLQYHTIPLVEGQSV